MRRRRYSTPSSETQGNLETNQAAVRILSEIPFASSEMVIWIPGLEIFSVVTPWSTRKIFIEEARRRVAGSLERKEVASI